CCRVRTHRDLIAWRVADELALSIHRWVDESWRPCRASTLEQLRRASLSVQLNIAEGFACGPGRRCRFHLGVAYASAVETTALLEFLHKLDTVPEVLIHNSIRSQQLANRLWRRTPPR